MSAAPVAPITLVIGDELPVILVYPDEEGGVITFGVLFRHIAGRMGEDFNLERIAFYDREYRHIPFGYDGQPVEHSFVRAMIMNENLVSFYFRGPEHSTAINTWPWVMTEEDEAWVAERLAHSLAREEKRNKNQ